MTAEAPAPAISDTLIAKPGTLGVRTRRNAVLSAPKLEPGRYLALEDAGETVIVPLTEELTKLGRSVGADVEVDDATVSRKHARILIEGDEAVLLDDRSLNGTWVGGQRITRHVLADADRFLLGRVELRFIHVA